MLFKLCIALPLLFATASSFADSVGRCHVRSAKIEGTIAGAKFRGGMCIVTVAIDSWKPSRVCPMKAKEELVIAVGLTEKQCPLDEGPVKGVYSSDMLNFRGFRGSVDGHRVPN